jgi:hypothetical protein
MTPGIGQIIAIKLSAPCDRLFTAKFSERYFDLIKL